MRVARLRRRVGAHQKGRVPMRIMLELTDDGDVIDENGESHSLFHYDPESLGNDPVE